MPTIPPENTVELTITFRDPDSGVVADPSTVRLTLRQAGQNAVSYVYGTDPEVTRVSTGVYRMLLEPPAPGTTWFYRWEGDGAAVEAAEQGEFQIAPSLV